MKQRASSQDPVIVYFSAGAWKHEFPIGELRYPIYLISQNRPALYVEPPFTLRDFTGNPARRDIRQKHGRLREVPGTRMTVFTPQTLLPYSPRLPLPGAVQRLILNSNIRSIIAQTENIFHRLHPRAERPAIVWGTIFHHAGFLRDMPADHRLAIIDDNFPVSPVFNPGQRQTVARLEAELIERADYIFTTSQTLLEEKRRINPHSILMENGVPRAFLPENRHLLEPFTARCRKQEHDVLRRVRGLPRPRIGYVGAVNIRLNMPVMQALTRLPGNHQICLVGHVDDSFPRPIYTALRACSNIHFFPFVSHALVPSLLDEFDILLLPFELTEFSRFINPLKFGEYLSSGKPILSTPLPEVMRILANRRGLVYMIEQAGQFEPLVKEALEEDSEESRRERIALARSRTWEETTREMRDLIEGLLQGH